MSSDDWFILPAIEIYLWEIPRLHDDQVIAFGKFEFKRLKSNPNSKQSGLIDPLSSVLRNEVRVDKTTKVTRSRFEIAQDGHTSWLEFETDGHGWMTIWHTEVAKELRGRGIGLELVTTAFNFARENSLRVDVICPLANHLLESHPEFKDLTGKR